MVVSARTRIPTEITTPESAETRLGTLQFTDGAPSDATVEKVYDNLDFTHALNVFLNSFQGASTQAIVEGMRGIGAAENGTFAIFSTLMDSQSLFLTANCDTIYCLGVVDLTDGPMVIEIPPQALAIVDDFWFHWVTDMGLPGPDRGAGGKYLVLPPDYDGVVPEGGYFVGRSTTYQALILARFFLDHNDPKPVVEMIKQHARAYRYRPGQVGTSVASVLEGRVPLSALAPPAEPAPSKFVEASGLAFNTIPANDYRFFEQLDAMVQAQPASSFDAELKGQMAAIGIVKGQRFKPDERMKRILTDAAAVGNATSRALCFRFREKWAYYPGSSWQNPLFEGGYSFETPPPLVTGEGIKPIPATGARTLDARTAFFYGYTGITPSMVMRLTNIGSQYIMAFSDADGAYFDGAKAYRLRLPKDIPAARFWSLILYDNQTRSMLQTPQKFPRAGSQSYPTPAASAEPDGSTILYIGPERPDGARDGNWIQSMPGKGWFGVIRLYSPLQSFFDKTWRPTEIEEVR